MSSNPNQPLQITQDQFGNPLPSKKPIVKILLIVFTVLFVLAGLFVVGVFMLANTIFLSNGGYQLTMKTAEESPCAVATLGTPLKSHWMITGNTNVSDDEGYARLTIPVSGPRGNGKLRTDTEKIAGKWTIKSLELETNGREIQLVPADATSDCK